jgi:predicted amidohydrolase YtcJ
MATSADDARPHPLLTRGAGLPPLGPTLRGLLLAASAILVAPMPEAARAPGATPGIVADRIFVNGNVRTLDSRKPLAQAVAVKDGKIAFVGSNASALRSWGGQTELVDLRGATVVPGLVDAHFHVESFGRSLVQARLQGAASFDEVVTRTVEAARALPADAWVQGRGWDQNHWPDKAMPDRAALDRAFPSRPVLLRRVDGHAMIVNGETLRRAGITRGTPDPDGGRILRRADGEPTGVLVDNAMDLLGPVLPQPRPDERRAYLSAALTRCAQVGLTGVHDAGVDWETVGIYHELGEAGRLPVRVYVMVGGNRAEIPDYFAEAPSIGAHQGRLTVRCLKLGIDGALGSRGAALLRPYADEPSHSGLLTLPAATVESLTVEALRRGYQVAVHAIGDRGNRLTLDAFDRALTRVPRSRRKGGVKNPRLRIEHAQVVAPADIPRFSRLGVVASMQPTHCTSDMPWVRDRLGPEREAGCYAWHSFLDARVPLAFGSDCPVESEEPRLGLHAAVTRQDASGRPPDGWHPEQRLTASEALYAFTMGSAWAAFEEEQGGNLVEGKRADFTVLEQDPLEVPAAELLRLRVLRTVVGGTDSWVAP